MLHRPTTTWRDWYNPLRGLSMQRIIAMEDTAERGQFADLRWFRHHIERTDVTVQAAIPLLSPDFAHELPSYEGSD